MAAQIRASIADIVQRLATQLVESLRIDPSRVIITVLDPDDVPHFAAERDVLLCLGDESPDADAIDGGGRHVNLRNRSFSVVMRSRLMLDQTGQDAQRMTRASVGHLRFEGSVCDALELFFAEDDSENALALPARVGKLSKARRDRKDPAWVSSSFDVTVQYLRDLDQSVV